MSLEPRCAYDDSNVVVTGGGNGPYYLVRPRDGQKLSIFYLQAILCHPIIEAMIRSRSSTFRGGYYSHGKQFIKDLPVVDIDFDDPAQKMSHDGIVSVVKKLIENSEERKAARTPKNQAICDRYRKVLLHDLLDRMNRVYGITVADLAIAETVEIPV